MGTDLTGMPRERCDGDLDTVALADRGALEFRVLDAPATVPIGSSLELDVQVASPEFAWVVAGVEAAAPLATAFGDRWLSNATPLASIAIVAAPATTSFAVPNDPNLVGSELAFQALVRSPASPTGAAWSNPALVTVTE
jgi:hypothetical protein